MNNYDRMVFDKYAYDKPYIWVIYGEFERRVNATLEEYEGLKTGECRFDYKSWENRLKVTRKNLQTSIKCLSNDKVIKQVVKGKKGHGSSIYFLLRFEDKIRDNFKDSNTNGLQGEEDNKNNMDNKKDNNMDNKKDNYKISNINVTQDKADNKKDNNMDNKKVNTSIYNNPNIISNNIYSSSKDEVSSKGSIKTNTTKEPIKKEIDRKYLEIFEYWNSLKIIKHKECNEEIIKAIDKALKKYDIETIKLAINNYNTLFKDKRHFYSHRWALKNFLSQGNGISEFLEDGQQYINYQDNLAKYEKEKNKPSSEEERKIEETDFS